MNFAAIAIKRPVFSALAMYVFHFTLDMLMAMLVCLLVAWALAR